MPENATVRGVDDAGHIVCRWDTGSSLNLIPGVDQFKIVGVFTEKIKSQILQIRAEGQTDMLDITIVQRFAYEKGFFDLVDFIEDDRTAYVHFILCGQYPRNRAIMDYEKQPSLTPGRFCCGKVNSTITD